MKSIKYRCLILVFSVIVSMFLMQCSFSSTRKEMIGKTSPLEKNESETGLFLADTHLASGMQCSVCHEEIPPVAAVPDRICLGCHEDYQDLTSTLTINFHISPHTDVQYCDECHHAHKKSGNSCFQCHDFEMQVPQGSVQASQNDEQVIITKEFAGVFQNDEQAVINDWEMDHLGIIVKNIDDAIKHYQRLGMKIFKDVEEKVLGTAKAENGENVYKSCLIQNQSVRFELIQPVSEKGVFYERLNQYGEGVASMVFRVDDLAKEKKRLVELGIPIIATFDRSDGSDMDILFDTRKYGNIMIALFSEPISYQVFEPSKDGMEYDHLGMVVKDADKLYEYYKMIGFKPISEPRTTIFNQTTGTTIYGKPVTVPQETRAFQFQNKQATFIVEVNSPGDDGSLHREFLEKYGEGINHVHFIANNMEEDMANMSAKGFEAIFIAKVPNGRIIDTYFDTREIGNLGFGIWNGNPPFKARPVE